jgi:mRNA interferase RelE/StbE
MHLAFTNRFQRAYQSLTADDQARADKALRLLASNLRHPSLQVKKIKGTRGIWEARVTRSIRLTCEIHEELILLCNIGKHDETLGNP